MYVRTEEGAAYSLTLEMRIRQQNVTVADARVAVSPGFTQLRALMVETTRVVHKNVDYRDSMGGRTLIEPAYL